MSSGGYYDHGRPELVELVERGAERVLDLGCGEGVISAGIRRERDVTDIWGVEVVAEVAARAEASGDLDRVLSGDLEKLLPNLPENYFSHIVAGDVLEHLVDPWATVKALHSCLQPGGTFICSIPNIRNFSFFGKLLFSGRFEYKDSGVMDRTHLRFFARKDVIDMFRDAGYTDIEVGPVRPKKSIGKQLARALFGDLVIKGLLVTARRPEV